MGADTWRPFKCTHVVKVVTAVDFKCSLEGATKLKCALFVLLLRKLVSNSPMSGFLCVSGHFLLSAPPKTTLQTLHTKYSP